MTDLTLDTHKIFMKLIDNEQLLKLMDMYCERTQLHKFPLDKFSTRTVSSDIRDIKIWDANTGKLYRMSVHVNETEYRKYPSLMRTREFPIIHLYEILDLLEDEFSSLWDIMFRYGQLVNYEIPVNINIKEPVSTDLAAIKQAEKWHSDAVEICRNQRNISFKRGAYRLSTRLLKTSAPHVFDFEHHWLIHNPIHRSTVLLDTHFDHSREEIKRKIHELAEQGYGYMKEPMTEAPDALIEFLTFAKFQGQ